MTRTVQALRRAKKRLSANGPGITVSVIAMVVALTGVAFAGAGALTGKQKKEVKALIKKEAKPGPPGPAGPVGPAGPAGQGTVGPKGDTGAAGSPGAGVKVTSISEGEPECAELGGAFVEKEGSGTPVELCNGEPGAKGAKGDKGEPWTPNNTLPAGATETGVWAFSGTMERTFETEVEGTKTSYTIGTKNAFVPLSFPIAMAGALEGPGVHYRSDSDFADSCPGSPAIPKALPGNLCVYEASPNQLYNAIYKGIRKAGQPDPVNPGANRTGAILVFELAETVTDSQGVNARGNGTFALTAPNPVVTGVSPAQGPVAGGTSVTITGENLRNGTVKFGATGATCGPVNTAGTEVTCTSPAAGAPGAVDVRVTVFGYESPISTAAKFTYQ